MYVPGISRDGKRKMFQSGGGEAPKDFTVSELAAEDGSTGERMELIDEQG